MNKSICLGMSTLDICKTLMYEFGMTKLNQSTNTMQTMLHGY